MAKNTTYVCESCHQNTIKGEPGRKTPYYCGPCRVNRSIENMRKRSGSSRLKKRLIKKRGETCERCGATSGIMLHHVIPVNDGGATTQDNCLLLCQQCHKNEHGHGVGPAY